MPRSFTKSARLIPALLLFVSCTASPDGETAGTDETIPVISVTATDRSYEAPDTVPAGFSVLRLVNRGDHGHTATVVRLEEGRTLSEYLQAYREANRTHGARPPWATFLGGVGLFTPGEARVIVELQPGTHALVCFAPGESGAPHLLESDHHSHSFVVRPRPQNAPRPPAPERDVTLTMNDYSFELSQPLEPGRQMIHVENPGVDPHHALLLKVGADETRDDVDAWLENGMKGEPPATYVGGMDVLSHGEEGWFEVDLPPGSYVLVCLVAGRDEVPHTAKGMVQHIQIG